MKSKILDKEHLLQQIDSLRAEGKTIVATGGCFDILHAGHVTYLEKARALGDVLILFLNSDVSVHRLKGAERPIVPEEERAIVVAGLGCIDYVYIFDEDTPCDCIDLFRPDIFAKGADYEGKHIPEMDVLSKYCGVVKYIDFVDGCSSTNIIEKIRKKA